MFIIKQRVAIDMPDDKPSQRVSIAYDNGELITTSHEFIRTYIRHIDQKASILLTLLLAALSVFANALRTGAIELSILELVAGGIAAFCATVSIILAAWVVYPRANLPNNSGYIYWEKILLFDGPEAVGQDIKNVPEEEAMDEIAADTYIISEIARNKYETLRWAVKITFVGGIFASIAVINTIFSQLHNITPALDEPLLDGSLGIGASLLLSIVFLLIISWFIATTDNQIDGIVDFWEGQLKKFDDNSKD